MRADHGSYFVTILNRTKLKEKRRKRKRTKTRNKKMKVINRLILI